jgi:single-stranded-DNA-specific exonuclease
VDGEIADKGWHRGVIGILASRVVDRTGKPALVITHEGGTAYGSGRSVKGFHLLDALTAVHGEQSAALLTRFGGHAHAVGFALPSPQVPELRARMVRYAGESDSRPTDSIEVEYDAEMRLGEISAEFLDALGQLGPFGTGNADPLFVSRGVRLAAPVKVVKERHLRVKLEDAEDGTSLSGMAWARRTDWAARAMVEGWSQGDRMDVAYRMRENLHADFAGWELEIVGLRRSRPGL